VSLQTLYKDNTYFPPNERDGKVKVKGKIASVINLVKPYAMKVYGGVDAEIHVLLDLWWTHLYWNRISPSTPVSFTILIKPTAPYSTSSGAGTIGQMVDDVSSGLSLTTPPDIH
jgi:hypothetical protein